MASGVTSKRSIDRMPVLQPHVAGIDLGSREHWACGPADENGERQVRGFGTTTAQLNELVDWLEAHGVVSVAMESTGIYWIPLYELLQSRGMDAVLVNARQLKHVPGRKTDVRDCQWIQQLHSCGLLRGSFRPDEHVCALRALHRQHDNLIAERAKAVHWMQKALDQMNVQVHRAVTDLTGTTGMAIVRAIVAGERDPRVLASHRDARCKKSAEQIAEHLEGTWRGEHLFNLEQALRFYDSIGQQLAAYETQLDVRYRQLQPPERREQPVPEHPNRTKRQALKRKGEQAMRETLWRWAGADLTRIDGINIRVAQAVLTELGHDLSAFPSEKHFVSWLRLSPRTSISGGKVLAKKSRGTGSTRVANALRMAALSVSRSKTALGAYYRKVSRGNDGGVAIFATARKLAILIYRMLRWGTDYVDIGQQAYEQRYRERSLKGLQKQAKSLGFELRPIDLGEVVSG